MTRPDYSHLTNLEVTRDGDVVTVTMMARNHRTHTELSRVFAQLRADPARVIVLTGTGDVFLGRPNLPEYVDNSDEDWQRLMREARWIAQDMLDLPQPLVVALNGDAVGLGVSLMSFGDIVVAVEGTTISENHVAMGIAAGDGGTMTLPFLLGMHRAKQFFLLDQVIPVEELERIGWVTRVVARADLSDAVAEVTAKLASLPTQALQWTKASLNRMLRLSLTLSADAAIGHEGWSWHLASAHEGLDRIRSGLTEPDV